jgi:SOS response regulatory protein OraA/RecX
VINQDFLDKYLAKNTAEVIESRLKLEQYLLDHGFTKEQANECIERGTKALWKHLIEEPVPQIVP